MPTGNSLNLFELYYIGPKAREEGGMANTKKSTDLTVFDLLEALTGELPCYASPNWNVSDKKEERPTLSPSRAEEQVEKTFC